MKKSIIVRLVAICLALLCVSGCANLPVIPVDTSDSHRSSEITTETDIKPSESDTVADTAAGTQSPETQAQTDAQTEPVEETTGPEDILNEQQLNSIAMLNYLTVLSQEINESKNSRLFLEEAYAALINNTNPENVNDITQSHLSSLLDNIEKYRMVDVKRDRLQYIYNQNKAKALKEALPNPIGLLSAVSSFDLKRIAAAAIYMAVDSYSSYKAYNAEIEQEYLQEGWALDDEETATLHDSRKRAFNFMIDIVREDNLPGELALSEKAVKEFVDAKNGDNKYAKLQFLESEEKTYRAFGSYWLELANCYYENDNYAKCLEAIEKYEALKTKILRKDYYFAQALPNAIVAASEVYKNNRDKYVSTVEKYLSELIDNTENTDWSLRYFAAEIYLDLYSKTSNDEYISKAYDLVINNISNLNTKDSLVGIQRSMNETYLAAVKEVVASSDATKEEKNQIKAYNKSLKEIRETELPPVFEPLILNLDFLFALNSVKPFTAEQKTKINGILHGGEKDLFLSDALNEHYSFNGSGISIEASFDKDTLTLPANCLTQNHKIVVTITDNGNKTVYEDWIIDEVERPESDVESFKAIFKSKTAKGQTWSESTTIAVEIIDQSTENVSVTVNFKVLEYIPQSWTHWFETVTFEQVK